MQPQPGRDDDGRGAGRSGHRARLAVSPTPEGLRPELALLVASAAFVVPLLLSRSTSPTPDHPAVHLWYRSLRQPAIKPPDAAIPIAWTVIDSGLTLAAYRLLRKPRTPHRNRALALLGINVLAIGGWSRLFFGGRNLPVSTAAAAAMIGTSAAYVAQARKVDRPAAAAGMVLTAWVSFATLLTAQIWRHNR